MPLKILKITVLVVIGINAIFYLIGAPSPQVFRFFGYPYEANFPTWLSSVLLLLSGLVAFQCVSFSMAHREKEGLKALGCMLVFMSCDETAMIHEYVGPILTQQFLHIPLPKIQWVVVLAPIAITVFFIIAHYLKGLLKDFPKIRFQLIVGAVIFCTGAFVIEMSMYLFDYGLDRFLTNLEIFVEESFELIGEIVFLSAMVKWRDALKVRVS